MFSKIFRLIQGPTQPLFSLYWGLLHPEENAWPWIWPFTLHILPWLRMSGVIPSSPYAFMVWSGGNIHFEFILC